MSLTQAERELRRNWMGGGDVYALYDGRGYEVWAEKVQGTSDMTAKFLGWGSRIEPFILREYEETTGRELRFVNDPEDRPKRIMRIDTRLAPLPDDYEVETDHIVEGKFVALHNPLRDQYGDPNTDEVPMPTLFQVQGQLEAAEVDLGYVAAYIEGRQGVQIFVIPRDPELGAMVRNDCDEFWATYVEPQVPPDPEWSIAAGSRACEFLKRVHRTPQKILPAGTLDEEAEQWDRAREARLFSEKVEDWAKAKMLAKLADAEAAALKDGRYLVYRESTRKEHVVKESTFRTPRLAKKLPDDWESADGANS